ncbi:GAF domain-containing protein [Salinimonas sediminis]|uniref:GAF domain-containing protein n=1 Tax=Salinimonas sediminis TaxID=2303538 RepID=A0A346NQL4_9ALTE|nr:GAF domain-containing protein [Salinimonas sediminis]AXR07821.1 GAF domain-containing protein [Salinimonas sediminis]
MPLQLAVTQPDGSVREHLLYEGRAYSVGRADEADITIPHPQVSRLHASLQASNDAMWSLTDTSSNGCFSSGSAVSKLIIAQPSSVMFGPVTCQLTPVLPTDVLRADSQQVWREQQLKMHSKQLQQCTSSQALLLLAQECMQQFLGCERAAAMLVSDPGMGTISASYPQWLRQDGFTGSRSFIRQCLATQAVMAVGDLTEEAGLANQQSIIRYNIKAALAVPLMLNDTAIGVLYADSITSRCYFTDTDIALVCRLASLLACRILLLTIDHKINAITHTVASAQKEAFDTNPI